MVLSWNWALSVRSGGRPAALFSLFRDTSGREKDAKGCERARWYALCTSKDARVIHAYPAFSTSSCPSRTVSTVLLANCLPISPASLARGKRLRWLFFAILGSMFSAPESTMPFSSLERGREELPFKEKNPLHYIRELRGCSRFPLEIRELSILVVYRLPHWSRSCDLDPVERCTVYILICEITFPLCPAFSAFFSSIPPFLDLQLLFDR